MIFWGGRFAPQSLPMRRSLFCPQWSQAAPMAEEGDHKPHEGEFPWLWHESLPPPPPGHGWAGPVLSL